MSSLINEINNGFVERKNLTDGEVSELLLHVAERAEDPKTTTWFIVPDIDLISETMRGITGSWDGEVIFTEINNELPENFAGLCRGDLMVIAVGADSMSASVKGAIFGTFCGIQAKGVFVSQRLNLERSFSNVYHDTPRDAQDILSANPSLKVEDIGRCFRCIEAVNGDFSAFGMGILESDFVVKIDGEPQVLISMYKLNPIAGLLSLKVNETTMSHGIGLIKSLKEGTVITLPNTEVVVNSVESAEIKQDWESDSPSHWRVELVVDCPDFASFRKDVSIYPKSKVLDEVLRPKPNHIFDIIKNPPKLNGDNEAHFITPKSPSRPSFNSLKMSDNRAALISMEALGLIAKHLNREGHVDPVLKDIISSFEKRMGFQNTASCYGVAG